LPDLNLFPSVLHPDKGDPGCRRPPTTPQERQTVEGGHGRCRRRQRGPHGVLLDRAGLDVDPFTGKAHTLYSLRHTAICMRIINSHGKVNIFNLAKNAGTSVDQIECFYAKYLPLSKEMARKLQSFGE
jgi:hypothetical protein